MGDECSSSRRSMARRRNQLAQAWIWARELVAAVRAELASLVASSLGELPAGAFCEFEPVVRDLTPVPQDSLSQRSAHRLLGVATETLQSGGIIVVVRGLLDNELLDGPHEVSTWLRPVRCAHPVAVGDVPGALMEIEWLCQLWGGGGRPLLPVRDGQMPDLYARLLESELVDYVASGIDVATPFRVDQQSTWDTPVVLIASGEDRDRWLRPVEVVELADDDPWRPVYTAVLGRLPATPDPQKLDLFFLRKDLTFEELFPIRRVQAEGSLQDLLIRLDSSDHIKPRQLSNMNLAAGMEPDTGFMGHDKTIPPRFPIRRAAGPNIIVVLSPGSVEDLALLWNLRAAHGDRRVLPIGVPAAEFTDQVLGELRQPGRATMFGWSGGKCHVTSSSLGREELTALTARTPGVVVAREEELLTFGGAPGRPGSQVAMWSAGRASPTVSDADRKVLSPLQQDGARGADVIVDIRVRERLLPRDRTMRGPRFSAGYRGGAAQADVLRMGRIDPVGVMWPPSWTALAATAQTRGLSAKPSEPGLAAVALLESLGGIEQIRWLLHGPLIDLLYRLGERSGMSWWKNRWTSVHKQLRAQGVDGGALERAAQALGRDDPAIAPSGEGRDLPLEDFRKALGGKQPAAENWVTWAEERHLLVRGVRVSCLECNGKSWLPMASLPPPVGCTGCGREIKQPYGASELKFTYRLGEPLRRVLETDSLGHVIVLRWLNELFESWDLVGAHPGVTFTDPATGQDIGEADVLLLFANGDLVPVEVKRRVAGADARTTDLMDTLAEALKAPWDLLAVTQPGRECAELMELARALPQRPRLLLTNDQLHEGFPLWAVGKNPFAAGDSRDPDQDAGREASFVKAVCDGYLEQPRDRVSSTLLDPSLK
ncbi:hypothetical protein [Lentzea sp. NPDC004782]|uniref:hypothetical protein n=1 Tax=Lentzea sp. NPDC004782 TaxID=3154458 RepID=UPI0033AB1884